MLDMVRKKTEVKYTFTLPPLVEGGWNAEGNMVSIKQKQEKVYQVCKLGNYSENRCTNTKLYLICAQTSETYIFFYRL